MGVAETIIKILMTAGIMTIWQFFIHPSINVILGREPQPLDLFLIYAVLLALGLLASRILIGAIRGSG